MNYASALSPMDESRALIADPPANGTTRSQSAPLLIEYWQVVRRWRWVILAIIAASLVAGLIITLLQTPQFTASTRIEISRQQQRVTNVEGIEASDANRDVEFYETQYTLLKARSVAARVARELRLAGNAGFFEAHGVDPAGVGFLGDSSRAPTAAEMRTREEQAIRLLLENVQIAPIARSSLVDIRYTSAAPDLSANISNSWARQFVADSIDRRFASTADARQFLEGRLSDLRTRVQESETELVNYANEKGIIVFNRTSDSDGRTQTSQTLASTNLEALNAALLQATAARVDAEARARSSGNASNAALGNQAINALRQRRAEAEAEYARLMVQFEPEYPQARALQEQIDALNQSILREERRVLGGADNEFAAATAREAALRNRVNGLTQDLITQERDKIQYNIFQREVDTNRELYEGLLQRYKEIGVAGVSANNISIVDEARTPNAPSSPILLLNLAIALLAGLGLAGAAIFALEQIDEGLRQPGDVNRLLGLPLLGSIPIVDDDDTIDRIKDPSTELSEAYLTVRSNLAFSTDHGVPRSFMLTSTRPREGKSTTSFALATVLARTGKRVLLVDADMRSPSVHGFFGLDHKLGFSNFLAGEDDWERLVQPTEIKGLSVMPAGPIPPSAAELLSSDRPQILVQKLLEAFDHVVIDAPPLLGLADAPLLSRVTEGVIYVVEAEGVPARGINMSLERLQASQAHLFGAILTKLKQRDASGYGYGYGYGLSYGEPRERT